MDERSAFTLDRFERIPATAGTSILRVCGTWPSAPPPTQLIVDDGRANRFGALPSPPAPPGRPWVAGYAVPDQLIDRGRTAYALASGSAPLIDLPTPATRPLGPDAELSGEDRRRRALADITRLVKREHELRAAAERARHDAETAARDAERARDEALAQRDEAANRMRAKSARQLARGVQAPRGPVTSRLDDETARAELGRRLEDARAASATLEAERVAAERRADGLERDAAAVRVELERAIRKMADEHDARGVELAAARAELRVLEVRRADLEREVERRDGRLQALAMRLDDVGRSKSELEAVLQSEREARQAAETRLARVSEQVDAARSARKSGDRTLTDLRAKLADARERLHAAQRSFAAATAERERASADVRAGADADVRAAALEAEDRGRAQLEHRLDVAQRALVALKEAHTRKLAQARAEIEGLEGERSRLTSDLADRDERLDALELRLHALERSARETEAVLTAERTKRTETEERLLVVSAELEDARAGRQRAERSVAQLRDELAQAVVEHERHAGDLEAAGAAARAECVRLTSELNAVEERFAGVEERLTVELQQARAQAERLAAEAQQLGRAPAEEKSGAAAHGSSEHARELEAVAQARLADELRTAREEHQRRIAELEGALEQAGRDVTRLTGELQTAREQVAQADAGADAARADAQTAREELGSARAEAATAREEALAVQAEAETLRAEISTMRDLAGFVEAERAETEARMEEAVKRLAAIEAERAPLPGRENGDGREAEVRRLQAVIDAAEGRARDEHAARAALERRISEAERLRSGLAVRLDELSSRQRSLERERDELMQALRERTAASDELRVRVEDLDERLRLAGGGRADDMLAELQDRLSRYTLEHAAATARIDQLSAELAAARREAEIAVGRHRDEARAREAAEQRVAAASQERDRLLARLDEITTRHATLQREAQELWAALER